ncbi:MAG TPA: HAMP domain-containing methyl-accepting chemotaxis protein [Acetobacteraceae bacterium]|nr:HAMP domain-containing methyl-accepting chemotaxis protein [Acetobacteraceae bacterium]
MPGFVSSARLAADNWEQWQRAASAERITQVVSDVQRAQMTVAVEIGQINAAALVAHPDLASFEPDRRMADQLLAKAQQSAAEAGLDASPPAQAAATLVRLRKALAEIVNLPVDSRDPGFVKDVMKQRQDTVSSLAKLATNAASKIATVAPATARVVDAASQVMDLRDAVGRRSIIMNNWVVGAPIKAEDVLAGLTLTGRTDQGWTSAERIIASLGPVPELQEAVAHQRKTFLAQDEPRWQALLDIARVRQQARSGETVPAWPYDLAGYRAWSIPAQANILALRDAALDHALKTSHAAAQSAQREFAIAIGLLILAVSGGVAGVVVILRRLVLPLQQITTVIDRVASGDTTAEVSGVGRRDEIGALAGAVQVFKDNLHHSRKLEREQAEARERHAEEANRVRTEAAARAAEEAATLVVTSIGAGLARLADGDLTVQVDTVLPPAYEKLRGDLNSAVVHLRDVLGAVIASSQSIRSGTGEIAQAADDLSRRTEQQAASLEETAAALEQITTTVRRSAESAKHAGEAVGQARADADKSGEIVREAVVAMSEIEKSAQQISQIISVIDEIAFQTNLLALNAGVEAARAGEAGRGFAVVASEVRALAQRSAQAAKEIKGLISTSTQHVGRGVELVGETGRALHRIVQQVAEINDSVTEIATSAQEQATGLAEVNSAVNQMDQVTQQNAAMVEQSTAASHALAQETEQLAQLTGRFRLGAETTGTSARPSASRSSKSAPRSSKPISSAVPLKLVAGAGGKLARVGASEAESWEEF